MGKRVNLADLATDNFSFDDEATGNGVTTPAATMSPGANHGLPVVAVASIAGNPLNKRPPGDDADIDALVDTIREVGVIQPLVVCSTTSYLQKYPDQKNAIEGADWVALIGNRRLQAARKVPLYKVPVIVQDDHLGSMYEVMLIENRHRKGLPEIYEAEAMAAVLDEKHISQRELAKSLGVSHVFVAQRLALLGLIPELRAAFEAGELRIELAREFGKLPKKEQKAIAAIGKPYRLPSGNGVTTTTKPRRSIRATTPAIAAESIRQRFSPDELAELIRLLTEQD
ncbi:MAG: ParB/RepB/Spo0J family partition protein [Mycobacterium sp.]|nr:ParB/RepB/Spo0J family partition protein [Mycobacterium sp.]